MKQRFPWLVFFSTWLLVFCGILGAPLFLITAYRLPCNLFVLILIALFVSGFMTLLFTLPELGAYMLIPYGVTLLLVNIFRWNRLYGGAVLTIRTIQRVLSGSVSFVPNPGAIPGWVDSNSYAYYVGFFVAAIMVTMALFISWGLVSGESMLLPFLMPLPLLALAIAHTDLQPAGWAGVLVCLYYGGLFFTSGLRLNHGGGIGKVTALALVSLLLTMLLLVKALPEEKYEPLETQRRVDQVVRQAAGLWEKLDRLLDRDIKEREDLSREGELKAAGTHAMDVKVTQPGRLYLRGTSYGRYDGRFWSMAGEYADGDSLFTLGGSLSGPVSFLEVREADTTLMYTPYAVIRHDHSGQVRENYISGDKHIAYYSWGYRNVPGSLVPRTGSQEEQAYADWAKKTYLTLSNAQKEAFLLFLKPYDLPDTDDPYGLARAIAQILRGTAEYDLEPGKTPTDVDFVLYFLTVSKRGYCVHYASALAALLQAEGVPARFVTGYALMIEERDAWVEVTDRNAHAWTEVYVDGWGWVPVEATGGDDPRFELMEPLPEPTEGPKQETPAPTGVPEETPGQAGIDRTPDPTPETEQETPAPTGVPEETPLPSATPLPPATPEPTPPPPSATPTPEPEAPEAGAATPTPPAPMNDPEQDHGPGKNRGLTILRLLLLPMLVLLYVLLRRQVCRNRMRRMLRGNGRRAVLYGYGELGKLVHWGASLSDDAQALANEAAFSNHVLGEEHKRAMAGYVKAARRELKQTLPWYRRWYLRYVLWLW